MEDMNLSSGRLLWPDTLEPIPAYPRLEEDISCDVVVIGGGESGALCAYELTAKGVRAVLIDKHRVAGGSTSSNTGLLQFFNDKPLTACMNTFGEKQGVRMYELCAEAIRHLHRIRPKLDIDPMLIERESLYYASTPGDVDFLRKEYDALLKRGFDVEWWDADKLSAHFPFRKPGAIVSRGDAEVNPFRLAQGAVQAAARDGLHVYEHTEAVRHEADADGITFITAAGHRIRARYAIIATGYGTQRLMRNANAVLSSSYVAVTRPNMDLSAWHRRCLIWETARPYLYMRTTPDGRVIIGGMDEPAVLASERDRMLSRKTELLLERLREHFPMVDAAEAEYAWGATFGSTHDGYPMFGPQEGFPHCLFTLGYGGNGTVCATIAAMLISETIVKGWQPDLDMFRFNRDTARHKEKAPVH